MRVIPGINLRRSLVFIFVGLEPVEIEDDSGTELQYTHTSLEEFLAYNSQPVGIYHLKSGVVYSNSSIIFT